MSLLYRIIADQLEPFLARQRAAERAVPGFVEEEFRYALRYRVAFDAAYSGCTYWFLGFEECKKPKTCLNWQYAARWDFLRLRDNSGLSGRTPQPVSNEADSTLVSRYDAICGIQPVRPGT